MLIFLKAGMSAPTDVRVVPTVGEHDGSIIRVDFPAPLSPHSPGFRRALREYFDTVLSMADALGARSVSLTLPPLGEEYSSALVGAKIGEIVARYDIDLFVFLPQGSAVFGGVYPPKSPMLYKRRAPSIGKKACREDSSALGGDTEGGAFRICESVSYSCAAPSKYREDSALLKMLRHLDDSFAVTLLKLIDARGMDEVECYKASGVSRQTWHKIMNDGDYRPSKRTVLSFAVGLRLSYEETQALLATVGFTLSRSLKFDVIVGYFIREGIYDLFVINGVLFENDLELLGG